MSAPESDRPYNDGPVGPSTSSRTRMREDSNATVVDDHGTMAPGSSTGKSEDRVKDDYADPSSIVWSLYLSEAEKEDQALTDTMTADTNGVLVFTGLFAAVVAAFIIESYKLLQPDSAASTVILLLRISQQLAAASITPSQMPPSLFAEPVSPSFRPTPSALRINILWFLSLSLSLVCALAATLMQQWARRYLSVIQSAQRAGSPRRQGRIHAYLFQGLQTFHMKTAVETLPALVHASVALFFAGLVDFLFSINTTLAHIILIFVCVIVLAYVGLTILPLKWLNCPYATPLSSFSPSYAITSLLKPLWMAWLNANSHRPRHYWQISTTYMVRRRIQLKAQTGRGWKYLGGHVKRRLQVEYSFLFARTGLSIANLVSRLETWYTTVHRSTLIKLDEGAKSMPSLEPVTLDWTLAMVMDDDAGVERLAAGIPSFLASPENEEIENEMVERLRSYGFVNRMCQLLTSITSNGAIGGARPTGATQMQRALSCLRCLRELTAKGYTRLFTREVRMTMVKLLADLRMDGDAEISIHASCTAAIVIMFLRGPSGSNVVLDKDLVVSLSLLLRTSSDADLSDGLTDGGLKISPIVSLTNIAALVRGILPCLGSASADGLALAWQTVSSTVSDPPLNRAAEDGLMYWFRRYPDIVAKLEALLPDIINAADEDGRRELASLVDGEIPHSGHITKSPYTQLYDRLRPLRQWLPGFKVRLWLYEADFGEFGTVSSDRRAKWRNALNSELMQRIKSGPGVKRRPVSQAASSLFDAGSITSPAIQPLFVAPSPPGIRIHSQQHGSAAQDYETAGGGVRILVDRSAET